MGRDGLGGFVLARTLGINSFVLECYIHLGGFVSQILIRGRGARRDIGRGPPRRPVVAMLRMPRERRPHRPGGAWVSTRRPPRARARARAAPPCRPRGCAGATGPP